MSAVHTVEPEQIPPRSACRKCGKEWTNPAVLRRVRIVGFGKQEQVTWPREQGHCPGGCYG